MKKLCLKCGEPFDSKGKYNRLCHDCKKFIREYGIYIESRKVFLDLYAIRLGVNVEEDAEETKSKDYYG